MNLIKEKEEDIKEIQSNHEYEESKLMRNIDGLKKQISILNERINECKKKIIF